MLQFISSNVAKFTFFSKTFGLLNILTRSRRGPIQYNMNKFDVRTERNTKDTHEKHMLLCLVQRNELFTVL